MELPGSWESLASAGRSSPNSDLHFSTRFQLDLVAVLVGQRVLDTDLLIRMIRPFDSDLCFFTFVGERRFYDHFDSSRHYGTRWVGHVLSFGVPIWNGFTGLSSGHLRLRF